MTRPYVDARAQLAQTIAQLHIISHVPAANLEPGAKSSEESIGGRRPTGGINHKDDRSTEGFRQKSAEHFAARARRCRSERDYQAVLEDALAALDAWKRTPPGAEIEWGSFAWRRQIATDVEDKIRTVDQAVTFYKISRATVYRYVPAYEKKAAGPLTADPFASAA